MTNLAQRRILLGVTGGIAAYKAAELTRLLRRAGADVRVVMTRSACDFVGPLTFQALSGNKVHTELLDADAEASMGHIELARWAEAVVVAPASADTLARLAQGRADDLLTTLCLATEAPLAVAPAMNHIMWANPATRDNMATLYGRGVTVLGPDSGDQACGETGPGRMREPVDLLEDIGNLFARPVLDGVRVMITAGPTHEPLDPVRYLANNSSGRMGFALAAAARRAGALVTLVAGPVRQPTPAGVERVDVETAAEMEAAVQQRIGQTDLFIACAAVADYRPAEIAAGKIKKGLETSRSLKLVRNPDILATVCKRRPRPYCVGFAAETELDEDQVEAKRRDKGADLICANAVGGGRGFGDVDSTLQLSWDGGSTRLGPASKEHLARELVEFLGTRCGKTKRHLRAVRD
ncbi:MAG: bifunctional phosphopantothenoylcysteine decarboxylase/phosphopantothenate--cysteine ligase CoaBC [Halofilum sp. (in: g-proteobacteria)]|nr:bifunctional phosphopantothenoylcysteine decarboxylase/phosphopantothenate--cysteine ligase CoaBC [Halofilum sp. (in: g-proteobacteria)]